MRLNIPLEILTTGWTGSVTKREKLLLGKWRAPRGFDALIVPSNLGSPPCRGEPTQGRTTRTDARYGIVGREV
jgi:hypothetical protein